jgi:hypothetical protein
MSFVLPDIIEGNGGRFTIKGWEFSRIFTVQDLTSAGDAMMVEATLALNIPIGTAHPTIPTAFAIEFNPESISGVGNAARVTVLYREFSQDIRVDVGSRALDTQTSQYIVNIDDEDEDLDEMVLWNAASDPPSQGVLLNHKSYPPVFTITRTEFTTIEADAESGHPIGVKLTGEILTDRCVEYNGKLSNGDWDLRPNDKQSNWQCQMSGTSAEDGLAFRVAYVFTYAPSWDYEATFKDPLTGEPVPNPDHEVGGPASFVKSGRKQFSQYYTADFNKLELS